MTEIWNYRIIYICRKPVIGNLSLQRDLIPRNNNSELYFEEPDILGFVQRLEELYPETEYVNKIMTHSWGQTVVRFYDPDGNLIEVRTPA